MRVQLGLGMLVAVTACASGVQGSRNSIQKDGPRGYIHTWYSTEHPMQLGVVHVSFRLDEDSYVMVGHLGGDGMIRVLYPASPKGEPGVTTPSRGNVTITAQAFFAECGGLPGRWIFRRAPFRNTTAKMDSYDGRGHGYLFMITSRAPMRYDVITAENEWDDVPVPDYSNVPDPRPAIRGLADSLASDQYAIEFANKSFKYTTMCRM